MANGRTDSALTPAQALAEAVRQVGGQSATARLLGVSQQAISAKLLAGKGCSPKWVRPLAAATSVAKHDLDPDLYPREPAPAFHAVPADMKAAR